MNAEYALVISVVNMDLQTFGLHTAVIPSCFTPIGIERSILVADDYIIKFFRKAISFAYFGKRVAVVVFLVSEDRKSSFFYSGQILGKGFIII